MSLGMLCLPAVERIARIACTEFHSALYYDLNTVSVANK
jgi:hypothetical protein